MSREQARKMVIPREGGEPVEPRHDDEGPLEARPEPPDSQSQEELDDWMIV